MPGRITSLAPGIASAVARPPETSTSGSASPWMTVAGRATPPSAAVRSAADDHRAELARAAGRVDAALEHAGGALALALLLES